MAFVQRERREYVIKCIYATEGDAKSDPHRCALLKRPLFCGEGGREREREREGGREGGVLRKQLPCFWVFPQQSPNGSLLLLRLTVLVARKPFPFGAWF